MRSHESNDACKRIEAFLAKVQRISATGSFFWRPETAEITASEQIYHIFDLDTALPLTLGLMATRVHPDDLPLFHESIEQARSAVSDVDFELRLRIFRWLGEVFARHSAWNQGSSGPIGVHRCSARRHERRLSEGALGQANAALTHMARLTTLGILAPSIAHEVTQPLAAIMINANTCLRTLATDPPNLDRARASSAART